MMSTVWLVVFWVSLGLMVYVCVGYPLLVALRAAGRKRQRPRQPFEPFVSIVVAAHNEAAFIKEKVVNLLALDYPADRLQVLVGSDGSTDATVDTLSRIDDPRFQLVTFRRRRGKPSVLNDLVPAAAGEIVVLADARQQFDADVVKNLVQHFTDPAVGAVSGELILGAGHGARAVSEGVGAYWKYEKFIRERESLIDSTVGATGAVYAIRKSLFEPVPADTILDDVLIPLRITRAGYRVLFEPSARVYDTLPVSAREEFTRKVRTLAGNFQLFARERWLLNPMKNRLWWQTVSHKVLRLFFPPLQLTLLTATVGLADESAFYQAALIGQIFFYLGAVAGWALHRSAKKFWPVNLPFTFCLLSWATVVGFVRCITSRQTVRWDRAATGSRL